MAFQLGPESEDGADFAEINIIPLVDVMLVLLIIFMVTAPLSIGGISVNLPKSQSSTTKLAEERIVLTVTSNGDYFIDKMKVAPTTLQERIKAIYEFRENKDLYIRADRDVSYGRVIEAMSAARLGGVQKLSMLTEQQGKRR